jgi:serine/threonine protein kinase
VALLGLLAGCAVWRTRFFENLRIGTVDYSSPEQCRGEPLGPAGDIYALGCKLPPPPSIGQGEPTLASP